MPALRDYLGQSCPRCRRDILQAAPSANRMPGEDCAWCPRCQTKFTLDQLARRPARGPGGLLKRLFGRSTPQ